MEESRITNQQEVNILIADDDKGHASLIMKHLKHAGVKNNFQHFNDGQEILDFLFLKGEGPHRVPGRAYLLLLDIRMPKVDGIEVLRQVKEDPTLSQLPVIMITTTDDPREVENCHKLGCNVYVTKPVDCDNFTNAIKQLGLFISIVKIPIINGTD